MYQALWQSEYGDIPIITRIVDPGEKVGLRPAVLKIPGGQQDRFLLFLICDMRRSYEVLVFPIVQDNTRTALPGLPSKHENAAKGSVLGM